MLTRACLRGSDIRSDMGHAFLHKDCVRTSVTIDKLHFKDIISFRWARAEHINGLEVSAINSLMQWCLRGAKCMNHKVIVCSDSQVAISVCTRFRSSSRRLKQKVQKLAFLCLVSGISPVFVWVQTKRNPADLPSRRFTTWRGGRKVKARGKLPGQLRRS